MKRARTVSVIVLILAAGAVFLARGRAEGQDPPKNVTCSFSNPAYSGWCKQNASIPQNGSAQEVCQGILQCLNNDQCNETYCNATQLRGGWKLEQVEAKP